MLLDATLADLGEPKFRAGQVREWLLRGVRGYDGMTNIPSPLRAELAARVPFTTLELVTEATAQDGTVKALFRTTDGHAVESVLMRYKDGRRSICVSSQSGCPLTCTFCATGQMKFGRNLTPFEILDQALHFRRKEEINHCVFMGMGEPLINFDNVMASIAYLPEVGITHRRTTISTVGWLPNLKRFIDEVEIPVRLAISVHAPDAELRQKLMPINERYPLSEVIAECRRYVAVRRQKVFIEYVMLSGVNDRPDQAQALVKLLGRTDFKVNLIPYNPTGGIYDGSSRERIEAFQNELTKGGVPATTRLTRGRDIQAACGQLAAERTPAA